MNRLRNLQRYIRLSDRAPKELPPLLCSGCKFPYYVTTDADLEPVLICSVCDAVVRPGLKMHMDIEKALDRFDQWPLTR